MANHLHRQIREALETKLTGLTTSATRVYANRLKPMEAGNLPGLRIGMESEDAEPLTLHAPYVQDRRPAVVVDCCAKGGDTLDDTLDLMSKEVEIALASGITVGSRTLDLIYRGMELDMEQEGHVVGIKRLRFSLDYTAMSNAPDVLT
jgi:hypothetical protein